MELKVSDAESVLDGELDHFIEGYLKWKVGTGETAAGK
jgi:hypothetical protein